MEVKREQSCLVYNDIMVHLYKEVEKFEQLYSLNGKAPDVTHMLSDLYLMPLLVFNAIHFNFQHDGIFRFEKYLLENML